MGQLYWSTEMRKSSMRDEQIELYSMYKKSFNVRNTTLKIILGKNIRLSTEAAKELNKIWLKKKKPKP